MSQRRHQLGGEHTWLGALKVHPMVLMVCAPQSGSLEMGVKGAEVEDAQIICHGLPSAFAHLSLTHLIKVY